MEGATSTVHTGLPNSPTSHSRAAGPRLALGFGAASCLVAAGIAARERTPPNPDAALTDLVG
jgi:hypothetical protein